MALRLYNTRTRSVEVFKPLHENDVRVYVCGLTPSAEAHIGHARSFLFFDVLRRFLAHRGYRVTYVQNVTDVDDRTIRRANETGESVEHVVEELYSSFTGSMRTLGVRESDAEPYATQFIEPIITMIAELMERGHAYVTKGGVYYRVSTFARYGELAHRNIDELRAGSRVEIDEFKEDPLDFALWKFAKPREPFWSSPWGNGRPGWHIECSAMSHVLLDPEGLGFDIHGGGADLIFPHHENEIAQSEPLMARPPMANFWVHGGLLLYEGRKMSKSLGNFEPLTELLKRHDPQAIRLLFLQTGYRKVMNFTEESLSGAATVLERLKKTYRELWTAAAASNIQSGKLIERVGEALDDDMNTSVALAAVLEFTGSAPRQEEGSAERSALFSEYGYALDLLGITPNERWLDAQKAVLASNFIDRLRDALSTIEIHGAKIVLEESTADAAIEHVIQLRTQARSEKDWATSDRLRDALFQSGVEVQDAKGETTWNPVG